MEEDYRTYQTEDRTVYRKPHNKDNPYVVIDKSIFEDAALSWRAKGLMGYLLSRPDDWTVRHGDLVKRSPEGASAVRTIVRELEQRGYMTRNRIKDEHGRYAGIEVLVHEHPVAPEQRTYRPPRHKPQTDEPREENPHVDGPNVDDQTLLSIDVLPSTEGTKKTADAAVSPNPAQQRLSAMRKRLGGDVLSVAATTKAKREQAANPDWTDASKDADAWGAAIDAFGSMIGKDSFTGPTRIKLAGIFAQVGAATHTTAPGVADAIGRFKEVYPWWDDEWPSDGFCNRLGMLLMPDAQPEPVVVSAGYRTDSPGSI